MKRRYTRVVLLWIHPGQEKRFERFEREAARIMSRHGGRIDSSIRIDPPEEGDTEPPYEVHIVSFPSRDAFLAYSTDPETRARKRRRDSIIARSESWEGRRAGPY